MKSSSVSPSASSGSTPPATPTLQERVTSAFERLSASANALNVVSDDLSKPIASIDAALKALNLGVSTWVEFAGHVDHNAGYYWDRSIGYAKVSGKWGIAISATSGSMGDEPNEEFWLFGDAPRSYRLEAVDKLPELIEKLVTAADETAEQLKTKIETTTQVALAIIQSPTALKDTLLGEIRKIKAVFYNTAVKHASKIDLSPDALVFHFRSNQPRLVALVEQQSGWLEEQVKRVTGWDITVSVQVGRESATREKSDGV